MTPDIIFYTNPMSRGQIVRWMLEEVGEPYEPVVLDYASSMKGDAYLAINPMGKVPAIVHQGHVVTECAAICAYLADAFPRAGLAPPAHARAEYYRWLFFAAGPVEQAVVNNNLGFRPTQEQARTVGYGSYDLAMDVLAQAVAAHPFICGDAFTAADVYVGSQVIWGIGFGTMPKLPAFEAYAARLTGRPAYKRAKNIDNGLIAEMKKADA